MRKKRQDDCGFLTEQLTSIQEKQALMERGRILISSVLFKCVVDNQLNMSKQLYVHVWSSGEIWAGSDCS